MPRMIFAPIITEKTLALAGGENIYTFEVDPGMTKPHMARRISELFNVHVEWVRTATRRTQARRTGRRRLPSNEPKVKKAFVCLRKGDTIPLFDFSTEQAK